METSISMADFYGKYQNENLELIDVREAHEFQAGHAPDAKNLPLSTLEQGYKELKPDHEYYVICQGGVRSASTCQFLSCTYRLKTFIYFRLIKYRIAFSRRSF